MAMPIRILDALRSEEQSLKYEVRIPPSKLVRTQVCLVSGKLPGPHCKHMMKTWFIPGVSPIETCNIHREVWIDKRTGLRKCDHETSQAQREVYEFWPSDLLKIFMQAGIARKLPPPFGTRCSLQSKGYQGLAPQISSPKTNTIYALRSLKIENERIPLAAVTDGDVNEVYWISDEEFLGKSKSSENFFWKPKPGKHVLRAVDDQGRANSREIEVSVVE